MPTSTDELLALLDLETIDVNLFRGRQPDTSLQRVFGGQVAGQAAVAAARTAPEGTSMHSMHSYFIRPGDTSVPIVYDVDNLRDGRSFATRRVLARQHGRPIYALTASFQVHEDGFAHQDPMPEVPAPEDAVPLAELVRSVSEQAAEHWTREWNALEILHAGDSRPGGALEGPEVRSRYWVRTAGPLPDDQVIHQAALTYLSDLTLLGAALIPHGRLVNSPGMQVASLDHTVWFHRPLRADAWLLYDQVSPVAAGARGLALGRLFAQDGTLVASVAQEGLIRDRSGSSR